MFCFITNTKEKKRVPDKRKEKKRKTNKRTYIKEEKKKKRKICYIFFNSFSFFKISLFSLVYRT